MTGASTTSRRTSWPPRPHAERAARLVLRFAFAALLLATGAAKLVDLAGFAGVVATYRLVPEALLFPAAAALAAAEVAVGLWLVAGRRLALAALATVLLHAAYLAWLALALARGLDLPNCGCFGVFWPRPLTPWTLAEDGVLVALATAFYLGARRREPA